jgi:hypothetical protein
MAALPVLMAEKVAAEKAASPDLTQFKLFDRAG